MPPMNDPRPAADRQPGDRGEGWLLGQLALLAAIALAPRRVPGLPEWPALLRRPSTIAGLICGACGALLALAGALALGANLTPYPRPREDGQLVQEGIYGVIRNPIYAGLVLGSLGWSLLRKSILSLALTAVLAAFLDRKARHEEQWLAQAFPEFEHYQRRVRRWLR